MEIKNKVIRLCLLCHLFKSLNMTRKGIAKDFPARELNLRFIDRQLKKYLGSDIDIDSKIVDKIMEWVYTITATNRKFYHIEKTSVILEDLFKELTSEEISKITSDKVYINGELDPDIVVHHEVNRCNEIIREVFESRYFKPIFRDLRLVKIIK